VILAGDIGGTKCNLALFEVHGQPHQKVFDQRFESREFPAFDEIISKFLYDARAAGKDVGAGSIEAAGFGVAGPVIDGRVKATNLPWIVDASALSRQLGTKHVVLLNDLEATAHSLARLAPSALEEANHVELVLSSGPVLMKQ
jgi:glucokinase